MLALKFNGINPMHRLRDEMEQIVDHFLPAAGWLDPLGATVHGVFPAVNVWEEGDVFLAEAEVPGMPMEDLDVQVVGNELTIRGERRPAAAEQATLHRCERPTGKFERTMLLPTDIDAEKVEARLSAGILSIKLPKAASAKARRVEVKFGG